MSFSSSSSSSSSSLSSPLQPFQEYPTSATSQEPPPHSSSSGSYSQVLIVLAIIFVVSIVGCVVGRIFCKDGESSKAKQKHHGSSKKKGNHQGIQPKDVDIEFGFGHKLKPIPSAKIAAGYGFNRGFPPPEGGWNGDVKGVKGVGRVPGGGHMEFKNGPGPIPYIPGQKEFKRGPGPMPYN